jgi:mono/diheme cytochrome c family protein
MRTTLTTLALLVAPPAFAQDGKSGEQIYKEMCARCHGKNGEGTAKYKVPLVGDKSVAQLALVVDRTMPEDDPDKLDYEGSKRVSQYLYDAFYSPDAQAKLNPPRVELSRLTVRQYKNAVADTVASFRPSVAAVSDRGHNNARQGLRGEYFNARNFRNDKRLIDRTDPEVNFHFGTAGPAGETKKESFDPHQFSIRWEGSVLAPETGDYEFVVRTEHALRLWVNDNQKALIDGWVKSGSDTEYKATLPLLAGRAYPVRLEFSKAKQGVDDSKKNPNPPPKPAGISLAWKRPHRAEEVVPARFLTPTKVPEVMVVQTTFPPDDRSLGWERGNVVSKEWEAATTDAALEVAAYVVAKLPELAGAGDGVPDRATKLKAFARKFAERAFRRPLTEAEAARFIDRQLDGAADPDAAMKRVVLLVLKSPRFLYPDAVGGDDAFAVASRLALMLWDSPPDRELLDAAAAGKLATREQVARHAERMLADPRGKAKLREFLLTWLKVEQAPELAKDPARFAGFDAAVASDLRTSLELFLDDVIASKDADFRRLLLSDETYLNGRLARFYGVPLPGDRPATVLGFPLPSAAPFARVKFEADERAGVLTHPYLLSALAYTGESSPIHRGVFVARGLLGVTIRPPMEAFTPLAPDLHPGLTTRERVALQTSPAACAGCHTITNPLGFALENYDAVGRYRAEERGKPVDATGSYLTRAGEVAKFGTARDLARFLAGSEEAHAAFAQQLFHHYAKQPVRAYGLQRPEELRQSFAAANYNIRALVVDVTASAALARPPK